MVPLAGTGLKGFQEDFPRVAERPHASWAGLPGPISASSRVWSATPSERASHDRPLRRASRDFLESGVAKGRRESRPGEGRGYALRARLVRASPDGLRL